MVINGHTYMAMHMIVSPSLKAGASIVRVVTIDLDELVQNPPSNA